MSNSASTTPLVPALAPATPSPTLLAESTTSGPSPQLAAKGTPGHTPSKATASSVHQHRNIVEQDPKARTEAAQKNRKAADHSMLWYEQDLPEWLKTFCPKDGNGHDLPPTVQLKPFVVKCDGHERLMYPGLDRGFNHILKQIGCTEFVTAIVDTRKDKLASGDTGNRDRNTMRPDLVIYPRTAPPLIMTSKATKGEDPAKGKGKAKGKALASTTAPPADTPPAAAITSDTPLLSPMPPHDAQSRSPALLSPDVDAMSPSALLTSPSALASSPPTLSSHPSASPDPSAPPSFLALASSSFTFSSLPFPPTSPFDNMVQSDPASTIQQSSLLDASSPSVLTASPSPPTLDDELASEHHAAMAWAWADVLIEAKREEDKFPFPDGEFEPVTTSLDRRESRGQLAEYASEVMRRQHRTFVFIICVYKTRARFVRLDRSSAIVSTGFDYAKDPRILAKFLYGLYRSGAPRECRGHDPTVSFATEEEELLFREQLQLHAEGSAVRKGLEIALTPNWPIYRMEITSPWSPAPEKEGGTRNVVRPSDAVQTHRCLIGRPAFSSNGMIGRGTKCWVAYDMEYKVPVFVKEGWRAEPAKDDNSLPKPELETYQELWKIDDDEEPSIETTSVPTPLGGGDVCHHGSVHRTFRPQTSARQHVNRICSRLVLQEICFRLVDFRAPLTLVTVMYAALSAHRRAWEKKHILHRDISAGNILIYEYRDESGLTQTLGLLADWDLAKTEKQLQKLDVTLSYRSGTWQWMSAALQCIPEKRHQPSDDLESALLLMDWCTLKCLPNKVHRDKMAEHIDTYFDKADIVPRADGTYVYAGNHEKLTRVARGIMIAEPDPEYHPFAKLLRTLTQLVADHYRTLEIPGLDLKDKPSSGQSSSPSGYLLPEEVWMRRKFRPRGGKATATSRSPTTSLPPSRNSSPVPPPVPQPLDHARFLKPFEDAFDLYQSHSEKQKEEWGYMVKSQHPPFPESPNISSNAVNSSKRSLDPDMLAAEPPTRKRSRMSSPADSGHGDGDDSRATSPGALQFGDPSAASTSSVGERTTSTSNSSDPFTISQPLKTVSEGRLLQLRIPEAQRGTNDGP